MYKTIKYRNTPINSNNITKKIGGRLNTQCVKISEKFDFVYKYDMHDCTELADNSHKLLSVLEKTLTFTSESKHRIKHDLSKNESGNYYDHINTLIHTEYEKLNTKHQETQLPLNELRNAINSIIEYLDKNPDKITEFCSKSLDTPRQYSIRRREYEEKLKLIEDDIKKIEAKQFQCIDYWSACTQEEKQEIEQKLERLLKEKDKLIEEKRSKYQGGTAVESVVIGNVTIVPIVDIVIQFIESIYSKINKNYETEKHGQLLTDQYIIEHFFSLFCDYEITSEDIEKIKRELNSLLKNIIKDIENKGSEDYDKHLIKYKITNESSYFNKSDILSMQINDLLKFQGFVEFNEEIIDLLNQLDCKSLYFFQDQHNTPNIFFTNIKTIITEIDSFKKYYFLQDSGNYNLIYIKLQNMIDSMSCNDSLLMLKTSLKLNEMVIKIIIHINKTKIKQFFIEIVSQLYYFIHYFLDKKKLKIIKKNDELNIFIKKFNSYVFKIQKIMFLLKNGNLISDIEQHYMINMIELYQKRIFSDEEKVKFFNSNKRNSESVITTVEQSDMWFEETNDIIDILSETFEEEIKNHFPLLKMAVTIYKVVSRPTFFYGFIKQKIEDDENWKKTDEEIINNHKYVKHFLKTNISISKDIPDEKSALDDMFMTSSDAIYRIELLGRLLTVFEDTVNEHINKYYFLLEICNFIKNKCENHHLQYSQYEVENHVLIRQQEKEFELETDQSVTDLKHELMLLLNKHHALLTAKHDYGLHHNHDDEEYKHIKVSIKKIIDNIVSLVISLPEFTYIDGNKRFKNILYFLNFIENLHLEKDNKNIETLTQLNHILNTDLYIDFGKSAEAELEYSKLIEDISVMKPIEKISVLSETILEIVNKTAGKLVKTIRENSFIITLFISALIKYKNSEKYECSNRTIIKIIIHLFSNKGKYTTFHREFFTVKENIPTKLISLFSHLCDSAIETDWDGSIITNHAPIEKIKLSPDDYVDYLLLNNHTHKYVSTSHIKKFIKYIFKHESQDEPSISQNELLKEFFRFDSTDKQVVQIGSRVDLPSEKKLIIITELKSILKQNIKTFEILTTTGAYRIIYGGNLVKYRNRFTRKN